MLSAFSTVWFGSPSPNVALVPKSPPTAAEPSGKLAAYDHTPDPSVPPMSAPLAHKTKPSESKRATQSSALGSAICVPSFRVNEMPVIDCPVATNDPSQPALTSSLQLPPIG